MKTKRLTSPPRVRLAHRDPCIIRLADYIANEDRKKNPQMERHSIAATVKDWERDEAERRVKEGKVGGIQIKGVVVPALSSKNKWNICREESLVKTQKQGARLPEISHHFFFPSGSTTVVHPPAKEELHCDLATLLADGLAEETLQAVDVLRRAEGRGVAPAAQP